MTTLTHTALQTAEARDIMEHVNEGHIPELILCARAFTPVVKPTHAQVTAVFTDGVQLEIVSEAGTVSHFVPYSVVAPPHEALRATVGAALEKLNEKPAVRVAHWKVIENRRLTEHFQRLVLDLNTDQRDDWNPGYACRFTVPGQEHGRPYTLRRIGQGQTEVDVYCHDQTLGSQWALGLEPGQMVEARGGRQESFPDFGTGHSLLLGDETALPTIAALLEGWAEEYPVRVLLEVGHQSEQRYLDDVRLPRHCYVSWLPRIGESGESLRNVLDTLETPPTAVWGALEVSSSKVLRKELQQLYPEADVRLTGYWRVNETN